MDAAEHYYNDDPQAAHPDAKTTIDQARYYFLGNGRIEAVIQICPPLNGTNAGLCLMLPDRFGPKSQALTFDKDTGLTTTRPTLLANGDISNSHIEEIQASWSEIQGVPATTLEWSVEDCAAQEQLYCPDRATTRLIRRTELRNRSRKPMAMRLQLGVPLESIAHDLTIPADNTATVYTEYYIENPDDRPAARIRKIEHCQPASDAVEYWHNAATFTCASIALTRFFQAARNQIQAPIACSGRMDASIWQYNLEWVRDQSMIVLGLTMSGQFERARIVLDRLLRLFVSEAGDTIDSGRQRPDSEIELDQNGQLLFAVATYVDWSGDKEFIRRHWHKIKLTADFPLRPVFRHRPSGMLYNRREFWERHAVHGVQDGFELMYQFFVSFGLQHAARLAELIGETTQAHVWRTASQNLRDAFIGENAYALVDNGRLVKRRGLDAQIHEQITPPDSSDLPDGIPLTEPGRHYLEPDSSAALPIALEFIGPRDALARTTLEYLEKLRNQRWEGGGYGRYNISSEPDSPGPWPFASMFIARANLEAGYVDRTMDVLQWLDSLPGGAAGTWFEFYGPRPVPPYPQVGITPWIWAEMIIFCVRHVAGIRPDGTMLTINPKLLPNIDSLSIELPIHKIRLSIRMSVSNAVLENRLIVDNREVAMGPEGATIPIPATSTTIDITLAKQEV